jgi:succinyl-CoA synthetase beta subunit
LGEFFFKNLVREGKMVKVHEYLAKDILRTEGIRVPRSVLITPELMNEDETKVAKFVEKIGFPQVLKAQVLVGGRMKAGGVKIVESLQESIIEIQRMQKNTIKGEKPYGILVEEFVPHDLEKYISISIDRSHRDIIYVYSDVGGIDIEKYSLEHPDMVLKTTDVMDLPNDLRAFVTKLKDIFIKYDLTLLEINPFVINSGEYYALDAVFHVDDSALFRQFWADEEDDSDPFVEFDGGSIGVIGCGAGIVMATIDALVEYGFKPANFCDIGGGATADVVYNALMRVSKLTNVAVLNIFGGITDCVEIAQGIIKFKKEKPDFELFIRLSGNNEFVAKGVLSEYDISVVDDMKELIESVKKGGIKNALK